MRQVQGGERVNSELKEQYNRYRFMFFALCLSGFLPLATLIFLYLSGPGLGYLGHHLTSVVVFFVLQVPICAMGGYLLGIRRMRFFRTLQSACRGGPDPGCAGPGNLQDNRTGRLCALLC